MTKVMMIALIILMIVMAVNSLMLSGNEEGLKFYLVPSIERANARGWGNVLFAAMTQAFFTLSVGMGSMEIFGSCIGKEHKLSGEAKSVMYLDTFVALMAGVIILPACFAYGISPITFVYDTAKCVQPYAGGKSMGSTVLYIHVICGTFHGYSGV